MPALDTLVSDSEREQAAERLRAAAAEGRLTTDEFAERIDRTYAARTHADLEVVLAGLPQLPAKTQPDRTRAERLRRLAWWVVPPNVVVNAVWLFSGMHGDYWPKWVLLATGIRALAGARAIALGRGSHGEHELLGLPQLPPLPGERRR
jgi:Domain of unknown function (DUF1707)